MKSEVTRRRFGTIVGSALASFACGSERAFGGFGRAVDANDGRLSARPAPSDANGRRAEQTPANGRTPAAGSHALGLERGRDAVLHFPPHVSAASLALLVLP